MSSQADSKKPEDVYDHDMSGSLALTPTVRDFMMNVLDSDVSDTSDVEITDDDLRLHKGDNRDVLEVLKVWIDGHRERRKARLSRS